MSETLPERMTAEENNRLVSLHFITCDCERCLEAQEIEKQRREGNQD